MLPASSHKSDGHLTSLWTWPRHKKPQKSIYVTMTVWRYGIFALMRLSYVARSHLFKHEALSGCFVKAIKVTITGLIRLTSLKFPLKQLIRRLDRLRLLFMLSGKKEKTKVIYLKCIWGQGSLIFIRIMQIGWVWWLLSWEEADQWRRHIISGAQSGETLHLPAPALKNICSLFPLWKLYKCVQVAVSHTILCSITKLNNAFNTYLHYSTISL